MGQLRLYSSNAERQAAYRARKSGIVTPVTPVQKTWVTPNRTYTVTLNEDEAAFLSALTAVYQQWRTEKHRPATTTVVDGTAWCRWKWAWNEVAKRTDVYDGSDDYPYLLDRIGVIKNHWGGFTMR